MKKKFIKIFKFLLLPLAVAYGVWYFLNPNKRAWKNSDGEAVNMKDYPLQWFPFRKTVTIEGRDDLNPGTISGKKLSWKNGALWTY